MGSPWRDAVGIKMHHEVHRMMRDMVHDMLDENCRAAVLLPRLYRFKCIGGDTLADALYVPREIAGEWFFVPGINTAD
jgi:hypothetical protein